MGTDFSEKLLRSLFLELNKIRVEECPFFNLLAAGQGLTAAEMKRCQKASPRFPPMLVELLLFWRGGENDHQIPPDNPNVGMIVHKSRIRKGMHQVVLALAVFRV